MKKKSCAENFRNKFTEISVKHKVTNKAVPTKKWIKNGVCQKIDNACLCTFLNLNRDSGKIEVDCFKKNQPVYENLDYLRKFDYCYGSDKCGVIVRNLFK